MTSSSNGPWRCSRKESSDCEAPPGRSSGWRGRCAFSWSAATGASSLPTPTAESAELELAAARAGVEAALLSLCDRHLGVLPESVAEAVRYSIMGEGKRLR